MEVPSWKAGPGETLVQVSLCLPLGPSEMNGYIHHGRDWRKVLRYSLVDGPRETVRKITSRLLEEKIRESRELVIAVGVRPSRPSVLVLALGTRHPRWAELAPFHEKLLFDLPANALPEQAIGAFLKLVSSGMGTTPDEKVVRCWASPLLGFDSASGRPPIVPKGLSSEALSRLLEDDGQCALPEWAAKSLQRRPTPVVPIAARRTGAVTKGGVVLVGAGNYSRTQTAYHLSRSGARISWVVDRDPVCAALVAAELGAPRAGTDMSEAIADDGVELAVVASFHDTHAPLACAALDAGLRVFIEKPPAIDERQLATLLISCATNPGRWRIGYNRRYAKMIRVMHRALEVQRGPTTVTCVVREATIPRGHWYYWPTQGTRILGNLCHWLDIGFLLCGRGAPSAMYVSAPEIRGRRDEEVAIHVSFQNGSTCTIVGTGRGDGALGVQERIEARRESRTFVIEDFRRATLYEGGRVLGRWGGFRDQGHGDMFRSCASWLKGETSQEPLTYDLTDLWVPNRLAIDAAGMALRQQLCQVYPSSEWEIPPWTERS